jgi:hypothetical protein
MIVPLHKEYGDHDLLPAPARGTSVSPTARALHREAMLQTNACVPSVPWGVFLCAGTEKHGLGFTPKDWAMLREWGKIILAPLKNAGFILQ